MLKKLAYKKVKTTPAPTQGCGKVFDNDCGSNARSG